MAARLRAPALLLVAAALPALGLGPTGLGAQEIRGLALDSAGEPIVGEPVALHRVGGMGGSSVATATTDDSGRFHFDIQVADSALYFAAIRHDGKMYIGPPARGGAERVIDYVLRATADAEAGRIASALSGTGTSGSAPPFMGAATAAQDARDNSTGALWLVALLAVTAATLFLFTAPRYRQRRTRDLLVELATLENRLADPGFEGDREEAERRRERIRERLAPIG